MLYERLRPVDAHTFWYARAVALRTASPLLRAIPMILMTGILFPLIGLSEWAASPPAGTSAALLFAGSMVLVVALAAAISTILDILAVATLSDRGVNTVIGPIVIVLSGNLIPLPLFPDWFTGRSLRVNRHGRMCGHDPPEQGNAPVMTVARA